MPRKPDKVGKYEIIERIARGGMGAVYQAKHPTLNRYVILKKLTLKGGREIIERFKREASLMIDFRNDHIVQVYDHFREGSSYYIAMEYVDGISLQELIRQKGYLSEQAALLIFYEACKGLKYAHDKEVIHRDIKPANILISRTGEVKLTDFGIATSKEASQEGLTWTGTTLGTPCYMSPEQISDTKKVDHRTDIYSLGVALYEMLTGRKPFPTTFSSEAVERINKSIYTPVRKLNPHVPLLLRRIIKKTMNPAIHKRYQDLQEVLDILSRHARKYGEHPEIKKRIMNYISQEKPDMEPQAAPTRKISRSLLKLPMAITLAIALVVVLGIGGVVFYRKGCYFEFFKNEQYGSIEITANIPEDYFKSPDKVYSLAHLTHLDNQQNKQVYTFELDPTFRNPFLSLLPFLHSEHQNGEPLFTTGRIYLPEGNYHLELYLETKKYCKTFLLYPRVAQKQHPTSREQKTLRFEMKEAQSRPITLTAMVYDSSTGTSLYDMAEISFYLEDEQRWIDWKRFNRSSMLKRYLAQHLKSGRTYTFKIDASSYYPATIRHYVEKHITSAQVEAGLVKKPGTLVIESNFPGMDILINDKPEGYVGGRQKKFLTYGETLKGEKDFSLPPGRYTLTIKKSPWKTQKHRFEITSEETTRITANYAEQDKKITITEAISY
ncbi:MAG: protein kinase domain-containing protein [Spirochaetota bacterium]